MLTRPTEETKEFRVKLILAFRAAREKLRPVDTILLTIPEKWRKTFKDEFYIALLNIYGESFDASKNKPSWVGHWTNHFIYSPIYDGLSHELKSKRAAHCDLTGKDPDFIRLHQFLEEHAKDELKEQIAKTTAVLQMSGSKHDFAENYRAVFHGVSQIKFDDLLKDDFGSN
ncbi:MAG TPA: P63C domain-containing protein [Candidatus Aquilonibacter sp.]|nr:P63C domain-containing protein [Candidatus Aquilonibacter sp.]